MINFQTRDFIVILWLAVLLSFLMLNISNTPLWQDEAESALNALTITPQSVIPKEFKRNGLPMHECTLYLPQKDNPVYDWYPTAYYFSPAVSLHGWIPYYFIKLGIFSFGKNELGPRFFSTIFFILFLFLFYKIIQRQRGYLPAILTVSCISVMPNMLTYALQARYYTYSLFFIMLSVFCFLKYLEKQAKPDLSLFILTELFLYYTNIQHFILLSSVYFICILLKKRALTVQYIYAMLICFIGIMPHLLITKFYRLALLLPKETNALTSGWQHLQTSVNNNDLLIILSLLFIALIALKSLWLYLRERRLPDISALQILTCCILVIGYPFICLTTPDTSFYERIFIPLTPFMVLGSIEALFISISFLKTQFLKAIGGVTLCLIFLVYPLGLEYKQNFLNFFNGKFQSVNLAKTDSIWIFPIIE